MKFKAKTVSIKVQMLVREDVPDSRLLAFAKASMLHLIDELGRHREIAVADEVAHVMSAPTHYEV